LYLYIPKIFLGLEAGARGWGLGARGWGLEVKKKP